MSKLLWAVHRDLANQIFEYEKLLTGEVAPPVLDPKGAIGVRMPLLGKTTAGGEMQAAAGQTAEAGGMIAVVPLVGMMMKYDTWWTYGTKRVVAAIQEANADVTIGAIVLYVDSGGGNVDGTEELSLTVANSVKPIIVYVDGWCCSAALWASAAADHIIVNSNHTAILGSVGIVGTYTNLEKYLEMQGIARKLIRSSNSPSKILANPFEPLSEPAQKEIQDQVDAAESSFRAMVIAGRGARFQKANHEAALNGSVFTGQAAIAIGLADSVGTFQDALRIASKAKPRTNGTGAELVPNPQSLNNPTPEMETTPKPAAEVVDPTKPAAPAPAQQPVAAIPAEQPNQGANDDRLAALEKIVAGFGPQLERIGAALNLAPTPGVTPTTDTVGAKPTTAKQYPWQEKALAAWSEGAQPTV